MGPDMSSWSSQPAVSASSSSTDTMTVDAPDYVPPAASLADWDLTDLFHSALDPRSGPVDFAPQLSSTDLDHSSAMQTGHPSSASSSSSSIPHTSSHPSDSLDLSGDHSSYDLFSTSSSTFGAARYRAQSTPSSVDPSPQLTTMGLGGHDFLFNNVSPTYDEMPQLSGSSSSNPFDIMSALSTMGSASPDALNPLVAASQSPSSYGYQSGTVSPIAVNSAQQSFADLMMDQRPSTGSTDYSEEYHMGTTGVVPSSLQHFQQQRSSFGIGGFGADGHNGQIPENPSIPMFRQPSQPHAGTYDQPYLSASAQADMALRLPVSGMGVDGSLGMKMTQPAGSGSDLVSFIRPYLEQYVESSNRIALGERTVIVMSPKVGQKSYGTEKRFLCPPPTAVLIGNSWCSETSRRGQEPKAVAPRVVVSISGEPTPNECSIEWTTTAGKPFDMSDPPTEDTTYIGRCVGKQLYISEVDERKKKVEAVVKIVAPTVDDEPERVIGTFSSRPIKVISKPSKKRQSAKNLELCINHGSTISLFHRLRSQTVSTKYLCVSGSGASFKGSDGASLRGIDQRTRGSTPSFIARTASWDPFVMYIVDVNKPAGGVDTPPPPPPHPEYPSPPPNAIPYTNNGSQIPIYYNQTVVLQCLTSGVVSPVLIIRKVDHATVVVGGGLQDGAKGVPDHFCPPGEVCGDPVSQLHKIALEVYDPNKGAPQPGTPGSTGAFLSCMGEKVNTYRPSEGRQWNSPNTSPGSHSPSLPGSPIISTPTSSTGPDYFSHLSSGPSTPTSPTFSDYPPSAYPPSSDGGRVRRAKRGSISSNPAAKPTSKARRRVNSVGSSSGSRGGADSAMSSGALWAVDIGETAVWTIVGTDQVRYNFYVPPVLFDSASSASMSPRIPSKPVTPFPSVVKYLPPDRASELPKCNSSSRQNIMKPNPLASKMLTLYGENFSRSEPFHVFFGPDPSPHVEVRCTEVLACLPPENSMTTNGTKKPILLVRSDGVIFPSSVYFS